MPGTSTNPVILTNEERRELESRAHKHASPYNDVIRAKIVVLAAQNLPNDVIASRLGTSRKIVSKWRKRFCLARLAGLETVPEPIAIDLPKPFASRLTSLYAGEPQLGDDGMEHPIDATKVSVAQGMWLYSLCCKVRPRKTLEIGFAYGFSTVFFLAAISRNGIGHHTAVDPFQRQFWHGVGLQNIRQLGMEEKLRFVEMLSFPPLIGFAAAGEQFDVIFIDGNHRFDDVLVDFTLACGVCPVGGHIILDDMRMPSVQKVVGFIRANRKDFVSVKALVENTAAFRRVGPDTREWDHFRDFRRASPISSPDSWDDRVRRVKQTIVGLVPRSDSFILVDEERLGMGDSVSGRRRVPFLERNGEYWGIPTDDEHAIREIERLRRGGASFIVFSWLTFWWLDHYSGMCRHLYMNSRCVLEDDRLLVFDLREKAMSG